MLRNLLKKVRRFFTKSVACDQNRDKLCPRKLDIEISSTGQVYIKNSLSIITCCKSQEQIKALKRARGC